MQAAATPSILSKTKLPSHIKMYILWFSCMYVDFKHLIKTLEENKYYLHLWKVSIKNTWHYLAMTVAQCCAQSPALLSWAKTEPWRIRNGKHASGEIWPFHIVSQKWGTTKIRWRDTQERLLGQERNFQRWLILAAGVRGLTQHTRDCIPSEV